MPFSSFQFTVNISMKHSSDLTSCHRGPQAPTSPGPKAPLQISLSTLCRICGPHCSPAKRTGCNPARLHSRRGRRHGTRRSAACRAGSPRIGPCKLGSAGRPEESERLGLLGGDPGRGQLPVLSTGSGWGIAQWAGMPIPVSLTEAHCGFVSL